MAKQSDQILVFHQLCLSTEHHERASINAPCGGGSQPSLSLRITCRNSASLKEKGGWIFDNCGVILTLINHWLEPPLVLPWCSEVMLGTFSAPQSDKF